MGGLRTRSDVNVGEGEREAQDETTEVWDAVVVGASFAGLAFASAAAARGMRVLVIERDPRPGGVVRTTGILFSDVLDVLDVPQRFLMNAVNRIRFHAPTLAPFEVSSRAYRFYMGDVTGILGWMAGRAEEHGAVVRCGTLFQDARPDGPGILRVSLVTGRPTSGAEGDSETAGGPSQAPRQQPYTVRTRFLIGADGARSQVARKTGLAQNKRFLAGAEWLVEGVELDRETFYLVMDQELAPGYCVWLAPHGDIVALGVAGHERAFRPNETLKQAARLFADVADLSQMRIVERKGGTIPVGGRLRRVYRDDAGGRVLLLGDAAGLCGAATGGGIYPALVCGRLAAQAVTDEVMNGTRGAVRAYLRALPHYGRLGSYLRIEDWIRMGMDRIGSNEDAAGFYGLFATPQGNAVLRRTLFETPIPSMDGSFFGMVRGLLTKNPALYGSALRLAWRKLRGQPATRPAIPAPQTAPRDPSVAHVRATKR